MKALLLVFLVLVSTIAFSQSYDSLLEKAANAIQKENYKEAYHFFSIAFTDSSKIGKYDLTSAATSAAKSKHPTQAIHWLILSIEKGIGKNKEELDFLLNDSSYSTLHKHKDWPKIVTMAENNYRKEIHKLKTDSINWMTEINKNSVFNKIPIEINNGFALYFRKFQNQTIPFLVYIPKAYNSMNSNTIVFLHGGVVSTDEFNYKDPMIRTEPIFTVADSLKFMVIYPLGKKDFGWVNQKEGFENVLEIINEVITKYQIDKTKIYLGGMSNGGTATFWFASQKPNIFQGFFAISSFPKLNIEEINFNNLAQGKPFISINDKNDELYKFKDVEKIYNNEKSKAKDWVFESTTSTGHGFIYNPDDGTKTLKTLISKMLSKSK